MEPIDSISVNDPTEGVNPPPIGEVLAPPKQDNFANYPRHRSGKIIAYDKSRLKAAKESFFGLSWLAVMGIVATFVCFSALVSSLSLFLGAYMCTILLLGSAAWKPVSKMAMALSWDQSPHEKLKIVAVCVVCAIGGFMAIALIQMFPYAELQGKGIKMGIFTTSKKIQAQIDQLP